MSQIGTAAKSPKARSHKGFKIKGSIVPKWDVPAIIRQTQCRGVFSEFFFTQVSQNRTVARYSKAVDQKVIECKTIVSKRFPEQWQILAQKLL
jgi:hypothetical protein